MSTGYGGTAPPDPRMRLGVVHARFNEEICDLLVDSARTEIDRLGAESQFVSVAGALEIPLALQWMRLSVMTMETIRER